MRVLTKIETRELGEERETRPKALCHSSRGFLQIWRILNGNFLLLQTTWRKVLFFFPSSCRQFSVRQRELLPALQKYDFIILHVVCVF